MPISSRFGIDHPLGTEAPDIDGDILKIVNALESLGAQYGQGTLAARPTSTPGSPGKQGRFYIVTSGAETGQLHYDHGTGWLHLNPDTGVTPDSITAVELAPNAVTATELASGAVSVAAKIVDGIITAAKLVSGLKPSEGAGAGTEALRALGTGAANAAAGNDARLSDTRIPTDNSVTQAKMADNSVGTAELIAANVTPAKAKLDSAETWNFLGILQNKSMRVMRHPYGTDEHIERGSVTAAGLSNDTFHTIGSATFTDAFASVPAVTLGLSANIVGINTPAITAVSTSGLTIGAHNNPNNNTITVYWHAMGAD